MLMNLENIIAPVFGDYIYIGGGFLTLVIVVLVVLYLFRRV